MKKGIMNVLRLILITVLILIGVLSYQLYLDKVSTFDKVSTWIAGIVSYIIIVYPVFKYWDDKSKKWFDNE